MAAGTWDAGAGCCGGLAYQMGLGLVLGGGDASQVGRPGLVGGLYLGELGGRTLGGRESPVRGWLPFTTAPTQQPMLASST